MPSKSWKSNLYLIFISELIVIMGFSFVLPFLPLYIQRIGNLTNDDAALWAGIAGAAAGIAMFISAPIWGTLADRWGRKPMFVRAMFGGSITLILTGFATSIYAIVALRFLHGLLTGTVAAASALVATTTPRDKMPFAMGLLMTAIYGGNTLGPLIGGILYDKLGYETTFLITGGLLFIAGLIALFFIKEKFTPPATKEESASLANMFKLAKSRKLMPILGIAFALSAGPSIISPVLSLFIKELNPATSAETVSGVAFFLMGAMATASTLIAGRMGQRINLKKILIFSCLISGILYLPPMLAANATQLLIFMAVMGLFRGGMISSSSTLVALTTSPSQQGSAYGVYQSFSSLGAAVGPLIGGALAPLIGLRAVFGVTAGAFVVTGLIIAKLLTNVNLNKPDSDNTQGQTKIFDTP